MYDGYFPWQRKRTGILSALVTTLTAVLRVEIDLRRNSIDATVLEQHRGIYFGLTRCDGRILLVARNLDLQGQVRSPDLATNVICSLAAESDEITPVLTHDLLRDLHQIRAIGHWLCVVLDEGSQIAVFDRRTWRLVRLIDLAPLVPSHLRHGAPHHRPTDPYHFNSLTLFGSRCLILAHNWDHGSFALELELDWGKPGPGEVRLIAAHEGLGSKAHDVICHRGMLHVLDSAGGALILRHDHERRLSLSSVPGAIFPRGMALGRRHILACYGVMSAEKGQRSAGESHICVIDRATHEIVIDGEFGNFGNPCDILLLSARDFSDRGAATWTQAIDRSARRAEYHAGTRF